MQGGAANTNDVLVVKYNNTVNTVDTCIINYLRRLRDGERFYTNGRSGL